MWQGQRGQQKFNQATMRGWSMGGVKVRRLGRSPSYIALPVRPACDKLVTLPRTSSHRRMGTQARRARSPLAENDSSDELQDNFVPHEVQARAYVRCVGTNPPVSPLLG